MRIQIIHEKSEPDFDVSWVSREINDLLNSEDPDEMLATVPTHIVSDVDGVVKMERINKYEYDDIRNNKNQEVGLSDSETQKREISHTDAVVSEASNVQERCSPTLPLEYDPYQNQRPSSEVTDNNLNHFSDTSASSSESIYNQNKPAECDTSKVSKHIYIKTNKSGTGIPEVRIETETTQPSTPTTISTYYSQNRRPTFARRPGVRPVWPGRLQDEVMQLKKRRLLADLERIELDKKRLRLETEKLVIEKETAVLARQKLRYEVEQLIINTRNRRLADTKTNENHQNDTQTSDR